MKGILHPGPDHQWKPSPAVSFYANRFGFKCKKGREDWFVCRRVSDRMGKMVVRSQQGPFLAGFPLRHKDFSPLLQLRALPAGAGVRYTVHISV